jgi:two-component system, LytTR family, response regulator LytT
VKILIVEDEEMASKKLQKTLAQVMPSADLLGVTDSIQETVEWIRTHPQPDLILMDIELADGQSFEIFEHVTIACPIIFTTSYDEYAIKAFKVNSVDYLLKPIQKEDLKAALDKLQNLKNAFAPPPAILNVENLVRELGQQLASKEYRQRFLVKHTQKWVSIEVGQIAYFFSDSGFNFFQTFDGKKFAVDYKLDELEKMLNPLHFFRISRSFLLSISSVVQIREYFGYRLMLDVKPSIDKEVIVSREKVLDFKRWMGK